MADVATVGLLQERAIAASELLATQLQTALASRVQLEQAKGILAQRAGLPMDEAFQVMRAYARSHNRRLSDVAAQIIDGTLDDNHVHKEPRPQTQHARRATPDMTDRTASRPIPTDSSLARRWTGSPHSMAWIGSTTSTGLSLSVILGLLAFTVIASLGSTKAHTEHESAHLRAVGAPLRHETKARTA